MATSSSAAASVPFGPHSFLGANSPPGTALLAPLFPQAEDEQQRQQHQLAAQFSAAFVVGFSGSDVDPQIPQHTPFQHFQPHTDPYGTTVFFQPQDVLMGAPFPHQQHQLFQFEPLLDQHSQFGPYPALPVISSPPFAPKGCSPPAPPAAIEQQLQLVGREQNSEKRTAKVQQQRMRRRERAEQTRPRKGRAAEQQRTVSASLELVPGPSADGTHQSSQRAPGPALLLNQSPPCAEPCPPPATVECQQNNATPLIVQFCSDGTDGSREPKQCMHCHTEIRDRTMLAVSGPASSEFFHCECLKCSECAEPLEHSPKCYVRAGRVFCQGCYAKQFGISCAMCERLINPTDWVRRAREFVYHLACFKCEHCKRQLSTGEQFSLDDQQRPPPAIPRLLCKQHYLELVRGEQCSPKQKAKRVRTTFGEEQLAILQKHFLVDSNPDGADLERIAHQTGLSKRVTQVWFQKKYHGHGGPCRKGFGGSNGGPTSATSSMDPCLAGYRSATMTPSSSSNGCAAGQSPLLYGTNGSGSDSDGMRQLLIDGPSASPQPVASNQIGLQSSSAELTVLQGAEGNLCM